LAAVEEGSPLAPLVRKFGFDRVYSVGIDVLGYPPTWFPDIRDLLLLKSTLENR